ncbi:MAG: WbqC family protein [Flavobacteriales bacterium]
MKTLLPIGYFPPISYFAYLISGDPVFELHEHFVKQTFRNRCSILGANGRLKLLVPKEKANVRLTIGETKIHNEVDWQTLHWHSLESAYRHSPYFEYYEDDIKPFFEQERTSMFSTNMESIKMVCGLLDLDFEAKTTTHYDVNAEGLNLRNSWNKQDYLKLNPIKDYPRYIQVFSDRFKFEPDLSILDLLFCLGPRAVDYLKNLEREFH